MLSPPSFDRRLAAVLVVVLAAGCRPDGGVAEVLPWVPQAPSPDDPIVARVGDVPIFASDVATQARWRREHATPQGTTAMDDAALKTRALDDLIAVELLASEARARGHMADLDAREARDSAMVRRFLDRDLAARLTKDAIPELELRAIYERARKSFVHPRMVEIGLLGVFTGPRMKPEARQRREAAARELEAYVREKGLHTAQDFQAVARDPAWRAKAVSYLETVQADGEAREVDSLAFGRETARLRKVGDATPMVFDVTGCYIGTYLRERPPENVAFPEVRNKLRDGYFERWRTEHFARLSHDLAATHDVQVFPDAWLRPAGPG